MSVLQDKIYGREVIITRPRKIMITGRGGSGNARKSISSASGESNASSSTASVNASARLALESDRSTRTRRWSSASDDYSSVINIARDFSQMDADLYTISSHSTSTADSAALSDIPSFISEYTFKTSSNPSHRSRPSTQSSNPSRRSGQSDWLAQIPRSYSDDSLPQAITEEVEANPIKPKMTPPVSFFDPFMTGYVPKEPYQRRPSEIAPFDEPPPSPESSAQNGNVLPKSPKRGFRMFRRSSTTRAEPVDTRPPSAYTLNFPAQYGQSTETVNLRSNSLPTDNYAPILEARRRNSNSFAASAKQALRLGN